MALIDPKAAAAFVRAGKDIRREHGAKISRSAALLTGGSGSKLPPITVVRKINLGGGTGPLTRQQKRAMERKAR